MVVPIAFRRRLLNELHEGHQGIVATKSIAHSYLWWPGLDSDIEDMGNSCEICQAVSE